MEIRAFYKKLLFVFPIMVACLLVMPSMVYAKKKQKPTPLIYKGKDGSLQYISDAKGNRVIDFSYCGYENSEKSIPTIEAKVLVPSIDGDATQWIQNAIDYVSSLPVDKNGFRGAIQFEAGTYNVAGRLVINKSGIILRGSGMKEGGTQLVVKGKDRLTFIRVLGEALQNLGEASEINSAYIPVNAQYVCVSQPQNFKKNQQILVHRPSTDKWIKAIGMAEMGGEETGYLGWKAGQRDLYWDRTIKNIKGDTLFFKVPLTTALDTTYGISEVIPYQWDGRIQNIGIENLALISDYNKENPKDEDHCHTAISIENAQNVWVRQVTFTHFAGSAVAVYETASKVTVEDCLSLQPVSEIGGWRRNTFFTMGQQTLFQRLYAEGGYHDFATGFCANGPNAFIECYSNQPYSFNGPIDSWASGLLFDIVQVDGQMISFNNHYNDSQGSGWCAANSMLWQCSASRIENFAPPTAHNWCFASWAQFLGNGYWHEQNSHVSPRSLYYKQLADRLGVDEKIYENQYRVAPHEATSSPTPEDAAELSQSSYEPLELFENWVAKASQRNPIITDYPKKITLATSLKTKNIKENTASQPIEIQNGWIVQGDKIITGMRPTVPWWRGIPRPFQAVKEQPAITRYVPGRYGQGYTDDLNDVVAFLKENNLSGLEHNYGLWYDRRRDDHERIRRMNGNVWAPFYVQPFARSGEGTAWDGLSKYDLTKYDNFYWSRLAKFAELAEGEGKLLIHHDYFQHNILEAGAHWADSPWRPANNINETDFPEPVPYAGDKRIFMAEQFYDINHSVRRKLHEQYIRQCLNNFADRSNVLQLTSAEFTGPLHFVEFWLDVIDSWQKENHKDAMVGLSATKDVQDGILNEKERAALVDVIDIRYWCYRPDSSCYAPQGGVNLAPRQHARLEKTGKRSFNSIYRGVMEYKKRFPEKAVIFSEGRYDQFGWAVLMAGGSLPVLPAQLSVEFMKSVSTMHAEYHSTNPEKFSILTNTKGESAIYLAGNNKAEIDLSSQKGQYVIRYINPKTGDTEKQIKSIKGGQMHSVENPYDSAYVIWITKK